MARDRSAPVPHHRVDADLYEKAKVKAEAKGISMSQIAEAGIQAYVESVPTGKARYFAAAARKTGLREPNTVMTLPTSAANRIVRMYNQREPELSEYLMMLVDAGWSLAALAEPLGISRQGVHDRVRKARLRAEAFPPDKPLDLPVPEAPFPVKQQTPTAREVVDWPVWVDRDLYAVASKHARQTGMSMRVLMEQILTDYIKGKLKVKAG